MRKKDADWLLLKPLATNINSDETGGVCSDIFNRIVVNIECLFFEGISNLIFENVKIIMLFLTTSWNAYFFPSELKIIKNIVLPRIWQ